MDDPNSQAQSLSAADRVGLLAQEWTALNQSIEWNLSIYDRYRAVLFALAGVIVGFQFLFANPPISDLPLGVWVVLPFAIIIVLYRMLSQFHLVNVKTFRLARIEKLIETYSASRDHFRLTSIVRNDNKRIFTNPYAVTQASMFLFAYVGIAYASSRAYDGLRQSGLNLGGVGGHDAFLVIVGAYSILFVLQLLFVLLETGRPSVEEKLHR